VLVDRERIARAGFRVVLDANGGAGGPSGVGLLSSLGCTVIAVGADADGNFRHEPEPTPANLRDIERLVRDRPGHIGAALDPDADRLVLIDETGTCLNEELTLALAVKQRLTKDRGPVVINLSTSRVTEDVARAAGVPCHRSAVGEANVVARMREVGALVGGEGNGGVIDPRVGWVRDPFIGLGLILEAMAESGRRLAALAAELPRYVIRKDKVALDRDRLPAAVAALVRQWPDAQIDQTDGVRFDWPDRWVQLRASNTEPIARVIAEGTNEGIIAQLCDTVRRAINSTSPPFAPQST
jgi:phosphomannomutase